MENKNGNISENEINKYIYHIKCQNESFGMGIFCRILDANNHELAIVLMTNRYVNIIDNKVGVFSNKNTIIYFEIKNIFDFDKNELKIIEINPNTNQENLMNIKFINIDYYSMLESCKKNEFNDKMAFLLDLHCYNGKKYNVGIIQEINDETNKIEFLCFQKGKTSGGFIIFCQNNKAQLLGIYESPDNIKYWKDGLFIYEYIKNFYENYDCTNLLIRQMNMKSKKNENINKKKDTNSKKISNQSNKNNNNVNANNNNQYNQNINNNNNMNYQNNQNFNNNNVNNQYNQNFNNNNMNYQNNQNINNNNTNNQNNQNMNINNMNYQNNQNINNNNTNDQKNQNFSNNMNYQNNQNFNNNNANNQNFNNNNMNYQNNQNINNNMNCQNNQNINNNNINYQNNQNLINENSNKQNMNNDNNMNVQQMDIDNESNNYQNNKNISYNMNNMNNQNYNNMNNLNNNMNNPNNDIKQSINNQFNNNMNYQYNNGLNNQNNNNANCQNINNMNNQPNNYGNNIINQFNLSINIIERGNYDKRRNNTCKVSNPNYSLDNPIISYNNNQNMNPQYNNQINNFGMNNNMNMNYQNPNNFNMNLLNLNQMNKLTHQTNNFVPKVINQIHDINYEDIYPYIKENKINISFKNKDNEIKNVSIPTSLRNCELYYTADKINNPNFFEYSDVNSIKLYLNNQLIPNNDEPINKNELNSAQIFIMEAIEDLSYYDSIIQKSQNINKISLYFKNIDDGKKYTMLFPYNIKVKDILLGFLTIYKIPKSKRNYFSFTYSTQSLDLNQENLLNNERITNGSTINFSILDQNNYSYLKKIFLEKN